MYLYAWWWPIEVAETCSIVKKINLRSPWWQYTNIIKTQGLNGIDVVNINRQSLLAVYFNIVCVLQQKDVYNKGKGKAFLVHAMESYRDSRDKAPLILNVGTRWRWALNITPRPLHPPPRGYNPSTHWTGSCVGLRASMNVLEKIKILLSLPGFELRTVQSVALS